MIRIKETIKQLIVTFFPKIFKNHLYRFSNNMSWKNLPKEEAELLLMHFFLSADGIFFDIGANTGIYTFNAEKITQPKYIYAFEPIPELNYRLKRMFKKSNIYKTALSDVIGTHKFKIPTIGKYEYKSRGKLDTEYCEKGETRSRTIGVSTSTLDTFINEQKISAIDFIKIDVEGHELQVVTGGEKAILKYRPVLQIEIEQRHYDRDIKEIINYVNQLGYTCNYLDISSKSLKRVEDDPRQLQIEDDFKTSRYIHNFIFIPDNREWASKISEINDTIKKS